MMRVEAGTSAHFMFSTILDWLKRNMTQTCCVEQTVDPLFTFKDHMLLFSASSFLWHEEHKGLFLIDGVISRFLLSTWFFHVVSSHFLLSIDLKNNRAIFYKCAEQFCPWEVQTIWSELVLLISCSLLSVLDLLILIFSFRRTSESRSEVNIWLPI